jgi:hypothetical protein
VNVPDLIDQLRRYVDAAGQAAAQRSGAAAVDLEPERRPRRLAFLMVTAALLIVVIAAAVVALFGTDREGPPALDESVPVFSSTTGAVMLFDDGLSGVIAVDLDTGQAVRRPLDGEGTGDPPFRLTDGGTDLIVGAYDITAVPLGGSPSRRIDESTIYVPAAETGEVWTLEYPDGRIGPAPPAVRRVDLLGNVTVSGRTFDAWNHDPLLGVPGGMAVATDDGIGIWNATTGAITDHPGPARATAAVSNGHTLVWCPSDCAEPQMLELDATGPATPQTIYAGTKLAMSPDGTKVAFSNAAIGGISILDLTTSRTVEVATGTGPGATIQWTPDSSQVLVGTYAYQQDTTTIGRYDLATSTYELRTVDVGGGIGFIVLSPDRARWLMTAPSTGPADCPRADGVGSVVEHPCRFTLIAH